MADPNQESNPVNSNGNGAQTALATIPHQADMVSPFSGSLAFEAAQRMAKALASSSLVPQEYRDSVANCLIAMELASRIGVSVLAAMQNLYIIQGRPSWSSKFLIATVNASGKFTPLRFEWAGVAGQDSWACRAVAKDRVGGERCEGPWITWLMATKEGWTKKSGSKWNSMPELIFSYRAAAFWCRIYCPEISIGFQTAEEIEDVHGKPDTSVPLPQQLTPAGAESLNAVLGLQQKAEQAESPIEVEGEVIEQKSAPTQEPAAQVEIEGTAPKGKKG